MDGNCQNIQPFSLFASPPPPPPPPTPNLLQVPFLFHHHFLLFCLWFLQLSDCLTAFSLIEILFTLVDSLTKHGFFNPCFQRYHLRLSQFPFPKIFRVTTLFTVSGMDSLPKARRFENGTVANGQLRVYLWYTHAS